MEEEAPIEEAARLPFEDAEDRQLPAAEDRGDKSGNGDKEEEETREASFRGEEDEEEEEE